MEQLEPRLAKNCSFVATLNFTVPRCHFQKLPNDEIRYVSIENSRISTLNWMHHEHPRNCAIEQPVRQLENMQRIYYMMIDLQTRLTSAGETR